MKPDYNSLPKSSITYKQGILYALLCYGVWGAFPIFWKLFADMSAVNILAHRITWSAVFLVLWVLTSKNAAFFSYLKQPKLLLMLALSGSIIGVNWGIYIYAVESSHIVDAGLGYYINPLVNVLLGFLFLKERLTSYQKIAVALAVVGVGYLTYSYGRLPWISLVLAITFGLYGLLKKKAKLESMPALTIETMLLLPIALGFLAYMHFSGQSTFFPASTGTSLLLMLGGVITAIPLFWFGKAAESVPLSTLGFIQYLSPSIQLLLGVLLYGEHFSYAHFVCFAFVWAGLALYTLSIVRTKVVKERIGR